MLATIIWVYPTNHGVTRKNYGVIRMIILTDISKEIWLDKDFQRVTNSYVNGSSTDKGNSN